MTRTPPQAAPIALMATIVAVLGAAPGLVEQAGPSVCDGARPSLETAAQALDRGNWAEAEGALDPLTSSHPDCAEVTLGLARLRSALGDPAEAERLFSRAVILAPDDAPAHALFADFQLSRGLRPQAGHLTSIALSLDPDCVPALVIRGQLLSQEGRIMEARQALERAATLDPTSAEARYHLGVWFFQVHRFDIAAAHFEAAGDLRPQETRTWDHLAVSLELLGEADGAERAYTRAAEINDGPFPDPYLDYNYGRFLLKQDELAESRTRLDRAVARFPSHRGIRYERAKLLVALEEFEAARIEVERALKLKDSSGRVLDLQIYYLMATIYNRLGEEELAAKYAELARTTGIPDQINDRIR